jgi:phenylpropionate dioxygenase-like ring-hydroxylating dioxygenase large terminal subunit
VLESAGNTGRRFTCPYHNWVYGLGGALLGLPEASNFADLDRDCHALTAVRCETWGPLVFINLDPDGPSLADFLSDVGRDLSAMGELDGALRLAAHTQLEVAANWKLPVDANIETYHVNYIHKETAALVLDQPRTGIQLLPNGHSRMLIRLHRELDLEVGRGVPPIFDGVGDLPSLGTFSYHVFPNLSVVFGGAGFLFFITNWPSGPTTSTYHVHWCSSLDPDEHREKLDAMVAFNQSVLLEDLAVIPSIQRSVDAGALREVRLSYQERRIYHVHEAIDRAIGSELIPDRLRVPQLLGPFVERWDGSHP